MPDRPLHAVILAGGAGTRFWPASRAARPKQYLPIATDRPLLADAYARLEGLVPPERVLVVTGESQAELVRETLPDLPAENLLLEPTGRNTAPAIALAALAIERREPESVQIVLAADHAIDPPDAFRRTLAAAARRAERGRELLTLGIRPTHPATGYGYIRAGDQLDEVEGHPVFRVQRFVEKPDRASADSFVKSGRFYWNSGNFVWSTAAILSAYRRLAPEILEPLGAAEDAEALARAYPHLPSVPVDKAILERWDDVLMLPIDYAWSDVGSWSALAGLHAADDAGNHLALAGGARVVAEDATGCIAYAEGGHLIALLGVHDLVVVHAGDATLVCPKDRAEDVKLLVERLRREAPDSL